MLRGERVAQSPAAGVEWRRGAVLAAAVLGTALAYMSDDMLNLAIPSVAHDLHANTTAVQWILNAYYVPLVAFVLVAGSLGDVVGHRRVFTAGLLLFGSGAVLCAAAPDVALLIAGRALQGVAAAMLLAAGLALVTIANPGERRDRAVGQFVAATAAVPALGPFISGALVDWLSWRWLFVVPLVLPLGALAITRAIPETPQTGGRRPDVRGSLAALLALCGLSVVLILGPARAPPSSWRSPRSSASRRAAGSSGSSTTHRTRYCRSACSSAARCRRGTSATRPLLRTTRALRAMERVGNGGHQLANAGSPPRGRVLEE
jgi:MFS family permease